MKIIMYGTNACPDCVKAEAILKEKNVRYLYLDWTNNIGNLKRFLKLRDSDPLFDEVKKNGAVGVPCFQMEDGLLTLDIQDVLDRL